MADVNGAREDVAAPPPPPMESLEVEQSESIGTIGIEPSSSWSSLAASFASEISEAPFRAARHLVSGSKRRTLKDAAGGRYDLDLTYILPRVIALGLPSSSLESWYRNPLSEVRAFLDDQHGGRYAMVNLCDERDYNDADWPGAARVMRYPFADHHAPALRALDAFCERAHAFMEGDEANVLAVHCKAGKGRTGVMVCAYLLYSGCVECATADAAVRYFRASRTTDDDAVNQPSQVRCVRMYESLLRSQRPRAALAEAAASPAVPTLPRAQLLNGMTIVIKAVVLSTAPSSLLATMHGALSSKGDGASKKEGGASRSASEKGGTANGTGSGTADGTGSSTGSGTAAPTAAVGGEASEGLSEASVSLTPWHLRLDVLSLQTVAHTGDD